MSDKKLWPKPQVFTIDKGHKLLGDRFKGYNSVVWLHANEWKALEAVAELADKASRSWSCTRIGFDKVMKKLGDASNALDEGRKGRS